MWSDWCKSLFREFDQRNIFTYDLWDTMRNVCDFKVSGNVIFCKKCRRVFPYRGGPTPLRGCEGKRRVGLGTRLKDWLVFFGITERRYVAAKRGVGFRGGCNCAERERRLNELGDKITSKIKGTTNG